MRQGNAYTLIFLTAVALAASLVLAMASQLLKERQVLLQQADMKRNILIAAGFMECYADADQHRREMDAVCTDVHLYYEQHMRAILLDRRGAAVNEPETPRADRPGTRGRKAGGKTPLPRIPARRTSAERTPLPPVHSHLRQGLWSSLYGYRARTRPQYRERTHNYRQGETPGLGGEMQSRWFRRRSGQSTGRKEALSPSPC